MCGFSQWLSRLLISNMILLMSRNYYSEIPVEKVVHDYLRGYIVRTPGAFVHEIGGTQTHIHMAITVPPTIGISDLIGKLKGASSHEGRN
jgi:hypothetical protein